MKVQDPAFFRRFISSAIEDLYGMGLRRATFFVGANLVVRATRRLYGGKVKKTGAFEALVTIGRPNYSERRFIRAHMAKHGKLPRYNAQDVPAPKKRKA